MTTRKMPASIKRSNCLEASCTVRDQRTFGQLQFYGRYQASLALPSSANKRLARCNSLRLAARDIELIMHRALPCLCISASLGYALATLPRCGQGFGQWVRASITGNEIRQEGRLRSGARQRINAFKHRSPDTGTRDPRLGIPAELPACSRAMRKS